MFDVKGLLKSVGLFIAVALAMAVFFGFAFGWFTR